VRAVVQRVERARVTVDGEVVGAIGRGLLVLVCAMSGDGEDDEAWLTGRLAALRVFPDQAGRMSRSIIDHAQAHATSGGAGMLVVSQFTLAADLSPGLAKGTRPSFTGAASPDRARQQIEAVVRRLRELLPSLTIATGRFAADMKVELVNDGPVTLWLDSRRPAG